MLAQLAGVMGKAMYEMQKSQERSFGEMDQRTRALCARVEVAGGRIANGINADWFTSKSQAAAAARQVRAVARILLRYVTLRYVTVASSDLAP